MNIENAILQGIFSLSEGLAIAAAFALSLFFVEAIKRKNSETSWTMALYFAISFAIAIAIFLPVHFIIGV